MNDAVHGIAVGQGPDRPEVKDAEQNPAATCTRALDDDNRDLFNAVGIERWSWPVSLPDPHGRGFGLCSTLITVTVQKSREIA